MPEVVVSGDPAVAAPPLAPPAPVGEADPRQNPYSLFHALVRQECENRRPLVDEEVGVGDVSFVVRYSDADGEGSGRQLPRYRPAYPQTPLLNLVGDEGAAMAVHHPRSSPDGALTDHAPHTVFVPAAVAGEGAAGAGEGKEEAAAIACDPPTAAPAPPPEDPHADALLCVICLIAPRNASLVHAGTAHLCCCMPCANQVQACGERCPMCRAPIEAVVRTFM